MEQREGRLDDLVGRLLIVGAGVGLLAMAVGLGLYLALPAAARPTGGSPQGLPAGVGTGNPVDVINLGILILMATPVARVAALVAGFLWEGRTRFALVSLLVLAMLFTSFIVIGG